MARTFAYLICCAALVAVYYIFADAVTTIAPVMEAERTARYLAGQQTARVWAEQFGDTARTLAMWGTVTAAAIVVAVQLGRTARHAATQRAEERRILLLYAAQYLPRAQVEVRMVEGVPTLLDYSTRQAVPLPVAERALMARGLLVDGRQ